MHAFEAGYLTGVSVAEKRAAAGKLGLLSRGVKALGRGAVGTGQFMVNHPRSAIALGAGAIGAGAAGTHLAGENQMTGKSNASTYARQFL
jgi:hypothetical protein